MGFGEPWRVIHSLPCTNSPVIHPQAPRPPLPVCLPHSARLTFLPPKCIYISPPSSGSTYQVSCTDGGSGMRHLRRAHRPLIQTPPPAVEVPVRDSPSHPGSRACLKRTTLSWGIDLLARARCHAQLVNIRGGNRYIKSKQFLPSLKKAGGSCGLSAVLWSNYSSRNNLLTPVSNEHSQTITLHTQVVLMTGSQSEGPDKSKARAVEQTQEGRIFIQCMCCV